MQISREILLVFGIVWLANACSPGEQPPFQIRTGTGIDFSNKLLESDSFNIIEYLYYYNGGGVAAGDVNNDGLTDLFFTANESSNRLYLNTGDFRFQDVTEAAGVGTAGEWSNGVSMADVNGDGLLDIYVCQLGDYKGKKGRNKLYINQGGSGGEVRFREEAAAYGLDFQGFATQAAFFDYDLDGDLDVYLLNHSVHSVGNYGKAASLRPQTDSLAGDRLLRNDLTPPAGAAPGTFVDVTAAAGIYSSRIGYGLGLGIGDLNGDGLPDIYVSNDFHENDYLYYNNGDGTFTEGIEESMSCSSQFSMGNNIADWNNDGRPDIITLDMKPEEETIVKHTVGADPYNIYLLKRSFGYYHQFPRNMLQLNRGDGGGAQPLFAEIAQLAGVEATDWSWSPLVADLDNDGWKDIFITNGIWRRPNDLDYLKYVSNQQIQKVVSDLELAAKMPSGKSRNYAFRNRGDLTFENVSAAWSLDLYGVSNGAALADLDNDGDNDLVLNNLNAPATVYENRQSAGNHYLKIRLNGKASNRFGIGARVVVTSGDLVQSQELFPVRGFLSAQEPLLIFGLGPARQADRIDVYWPDGGHTSLLQIPADQLLEVAQAAGAKATQPVADRAGAAVLDHGLAFRHLENRYLDLEMEPLMPRLLSTQGPRMAVADVNGDGREDVYICGARGQTGALFYQQVGGIFQRSPEFFINNRAAEEVDAVFFDADGDGDQDLYLVNGGGDLEEGDQRLQDQLYLNDGRGNFAHQPAALPAIALNGACVSVLDFNDDGASDLFVGSRSVPGNYGVDPISVLLQNDGQGHFREVSAQHLPHGGRLGMVTDAALLQTGKEKMLAVVGEWMPVQLYHLGSGVWEEEPLPQSRGWWNRVMAADCNGDGIDDLVLGNWGLNTILKAAPDEPIGLYVKDFDGNRTNDPILTYYRQGRQYPLASIDELTGQMPSFRKLLNSYTAFAALGFEEVFPAAILEGAIGKKAEFMASAIALSEGQGNYKLNALPLAAQLSPVFGIVVDDLDGDGLVDIFTAGNFYGSRTDLGMSDASTGVFLRGDGNGNFRAAGGASPFQAIRGEVRDLKIVELEGRKLVLIARNDQNLLVQQAHLKDY